MSRRHPLHLAIAFALAVHLPAAVAQDAQPATPGPDAVDLDAVVVRAQYESQVRAIDTKRSSDAILDAIASDSMGQYPDKNIGESLSRLPGISVTRDQGEGRYVVVRGIDSALNSVTVDGIALGTPEDSSRAAPLDVIPTDATERLSVVKAPTPDMPGDSIGGTIRVESASGFDRKGRDVRAKAELSHQGLSGETSPKASFNYSDQFNETFAVAFGLSYQDRTYQSDNIEVEYEDVDEDVNDGQLLPVEVQQRKYYVNRERTGANLNLDWRPDADNRYFLRTLYTDFTDAETRQRNIVPIGEGDIDGDIQGRYTVGGIDPTDFARRVRYRTKEENTFTVSAGGENRFERARIDYRVGHTRTRENVADEVEMRFDQLDGDELSMEVDRTGSLPRFTVSDPSWLRNDNHEFDRLVVAPKWVDDSEYSAAFDFTFATDSVEWKAGLLGRWRDRDVDVDERELRRGPDPGLGNWTLDPPRFRHGGMGDGISSRAMREWLARHRGEYSERPQDVAGNDEASLIEDYVASEDILAGYLMATVDVGNLRVIAGARVERTDFEATGNEVNVDEEGDVSFGTRTATSRYTEVLPGLHLRYATDGDWVLRGAYTNTIGRPSFGDVSPRAVVNREGEDESDWETVLGNPLLEPYRSRNVDLSFERYFGTSGLLSLGVFHKDIKGYIVETTTDSDPDYPGEVTRPVNGDTANVLGAEMNWQQHFDNGFLLGVGATWLDTEFRLPADSTIADRSGETFALPRSSEKLFSAHVGYEKGGLSTRLAAVHRSEYLDEIGDSADMDIWVAANTQLDFTFDYRVDALWSLYFEASNLLDEPLELYQGSRRNTLQNELYGRTYTAGVKLRF